MNPILFRWISGKFVATIQQDNGVVILLVIWYFFDSKRKFPSVPLTQGTFLHQNIYAAFAKPFADVASDQKWYFKDELLKRT